jgi:hypothetical protein
MQSKTAKSAQAKRAETSRPDPRLAAFARLLARHAAAQDFQKELRAKRNGANSYDPPSGDEPEDLP